jgi:protocatechuate 3,4-dioxygenase beta subunit
LNSPSDPSYQPFAVPILIYEHTAPYSLAPKEGSERITDANGIVRWDNLLPGRTEFTASRMTYSGGPQNEQIPYSRWWSNTMANTWSRVNYKQNLPKKGDGDQNILFDIQGDFKATIQMERGVEVSGTVVDEQGKPIEKLEIGTVPKEGHRESLTGDSRYLMTTDSTGSFHGYIPAGNGVVYNLCAYPIAYYNQPQAPYANAVSEPFQSKPGDKFQFHLQTKKGAWVTGRVVNAKGEPVPGLEVQSTASDFMDSPYADKTCNTDAKGSFRLGPLRPGHYEIRPDTEQGVNINTRITPTYIAVENGKDISIGDLLYSQ